MAEKNESPLLELETRYTKGSGMNDNPDDKKDNVEDMALADLLGMAGDTEDGRVQDRDDEPGSGIAQLSMLVATTSVEEAKKPSLAPPPGTLSSNASVPPADAAAAVGSIPPGGMAPPTGSVPPGGMAPPTGSVPPGGMAPPASIPPGSVAATEAMPAMAPQGAAATEAMPAIQGQGMAPTEAMPAMQGGMPTGAAPTAQGYGQPGPMDAMGGAAQADAFGAGAQVGENAGMDVTVKPKSKVGLFAGIGVGVAAVAAALFFLLAGEDKPPQEDAEVAQLQAKLDALKEAQAKPAEPTPAAEEAPKPAEETMKPAEAEEEAAAEEAKAEEEEEEAKAPIKPLTRAQRKRMAKAAKKAQKKAAKAKAKAAKAKPAKQPAEKSGGGSKAASELGSLLDADVASGKKSATGSLPATPSRKDVKAAMRPIQAKASKCSKYSKGTVKLKIVVGSNGRVQSTNVVGGTADGTAANCVAMIARTAKFPKFTNATFSFNYPVTLK